MRFLISALLCVWAQAAFAQGFAVRDLSQVASAAQAALGGGFQAKAQSQRVTLACLDCPGGPMVDLLLGRQTDGTEERVRSGETPISSLEKLCQARNPECRIDSLSVAPAVGWISRYRLSSSMVGSTAIILRGGDMLTVRSIASDEATARANAQKLVRAIAPTVVGR